MPTRDQKQIADFLNVSVWSAYTRINASQRFRVMADGGLLIPPDTAAVAMALLDYEQESYGNLVNGLLLPVDDELTASYAQSHPVGASPIPEGSTFMSPFQDHYGALQAAEVIHDEWVWHDMPAELYLWNQPDLDPVTRQLLVDLGYAEAFRMFEAGEKVYNFDAAKAAMADDARARLITKIDPATIVGIGACAQWLARGLGLVAAAAFAGWFVYRIVDTVLYRVKNSEEWANARESLAQTKRAQEMQVVQIESTEQALKNCEARVELGLATQAQCSAIATSLARIEPVVPAPNVPQFSSCGFSNCWPWALLAMGTGAVIGGVVAKKRGWV